VLKNLKRQGGSREEERWTGRGRGKERERKLRRRRREKDIPGKRREERKGKEDRISHRTDPRKEDPPKKKPAKKKEILWSRGSILFWNVI
jgi:hypothetical protein